MEETYTEVSATLRLLGQTIRIHAIFEKPMTLDEFGGALPRFSYTFPHGSLLQNAGDVQWVEEVK